MGIPLNYNLAEVIISINGTPVVGGAADGDKLTIANTADAWSETDGADGEFMRNKILTVTADATLNLMYGHLFNPILMGLFTADQLAGIGAFIFGVTDLGGGYIGTSARSYIKRLPDRAFGQEGGAVEWAFKLTNWAPLYGAQRTF